MIRRAISKATDLIQGKSSKRIQEFSCVPERTNAKNRGLAILAWLLRASSLLLRGNTDWSKPNP